MTDSQIIETPLKVLETLGSPEYACDWTRGIPEWMNGIGPEHIPALIDLVLQWPAKYLEDPNEPSTWAPVHAWRALGFLKAVEAVGPLLSLYNQLDKIGDDWYLEDSVDMFGLIGPEAIEPLNEYFKDKSNSLYPRAATLEALLSIAKHHPETRDRIVELQVQALSGYEEEDEELNGFIICNLLDLKAVESVELIKKAFEAGRVNRGVVSENSIRDELHVNISPPGGVKSGKNISGGIDDDGDIWTQRSSQTGKSKSSRNKKAKRKQQEKSRKKNRKK